MDKQIKDSPIFLQSAPHLFTATSEIMSKKSKTKKQRKEKKNKTQKSQ